MIYTHSAVAAPGGSNGQFQYNNNGVFGASSTLSYDGTNIIVGGAGQLIVNHVGGTSPQIRFQENGTTKFGIQTSSGDVYIDVGSGDLHFRGDSSTTHLLLSHAGLFTVWDGGNFALGTGTGTQWATAPTQKQGWWGNTAVVRSSGWSTANSAPTKALNVSTATLGDVANVLATLLNAELTYGLLGA